MIIHTKDSEFTTTKTNSRHKYCILYFIKNNQKVTNLEILPDYKNTMR